jgi:hypothetical protein
LFNGEPITWGFNPKEKRVVLTFPKSLGGETYILCIAGSYTLRARPEWMKAQAGVGILAGVRRGVAAVQQMFRRRSTA